MDVARSRRAKVPGIILVVLFFNALVYLLAGEALTHARAQYERQATQETRNLVRVLEANVSGVFDKVDLAVYALAREAARRRGAAASSKADFDAYIEGMRGMLPEVSSLRVADADGRILYGTGVPPDTNFRIEDREYFQKLRDGDRDATVLSQPLVGRISGSWVLILARRVSDPDGGFAGVAFGVVSLEYFTHLFSSLAVGEHGVISMRDADMALVVRIPEHEGLGKAVGNRLVSRETLEAIARDPLAGSYETVVALDGVLRRMAYHKVGERPLYLFVGQAESDYLAPWRRELAVIGSLTLMFSLLTVFSAVTVQRRQQAEQLARHELEQRKEVLESQVAARTHDLVAAKETAEAASLAKSRFLANMSHELRTPISAVIGMTNLALRDAPGGRFRTQLVGISQASRHLLGLINTILDLSKIEAERMVLDEADFRLGGVLDSVMSLLGNKADEKGLALTLEVPAGLSERYLRGDAMRFEQILINLVGNGIKFTDKGAVTVRLSVLADTAEAVTLAVEVADSGIGIRPEDVERLFRPFEQVDGSMTRQYGGTGLGLAITRRLIALMGGEITVRSVPGEGAVFAFTVVLRPAARVAAAESGDEQDARDAEAALRSRFAGTRILLADDDALNREVPRDLLSHAGLVVEVAEDGVQAIAKARTCTYDLILMDMQMPHLNGVDASLAIRSLEGYRDIPIVAMTANAFAEDRRTCLAAGMNDHLAKPVAPAVLFETVLRWLSARKAQRLSDAADAGFQEGA